jgi:hypothetical protein
MRRWFKWNFNRMSNEQKLNKITGGYSQEVHLIEVAGFYPHCGTLRRWTPLPTARQQ